MRVYRKYVCNARSEEKWNHAPQFLGSEGWDASKMIQHTGRSFNKQIQSFKVLRYEMLVVASFAL